MVGVVVDGVNFDLELGLRFLKCLGENLRGLEI